MNTERYQRQLVLSDFGIEGQQKLNKAKVLIVGAGGLGVPVMQYLAGMGVGQLTLMDADAIALSNLQRQVIYATDDVGKKKVEVAADRLRQLNPEIEVETIAQMISSENADQLVAGKDLVVDCTDSIEARYVINDTCVENGLPFVYGALYKHEGHVSIFNFQGGPTYRDIYPDDSAQVENCNEIGVLGVLPGIIGCYQAMEAVKILTGIGDNLSGKLLVVDALGANHDVFQLAKNPVKKNAEPAEEAFTEKLLTWVELNDLNLREFHLLDVREPDEFERDSDDRFENVPMNTLPGFVPDEEKAVVLVCNRGNATKQAATLILANFPRKAVYQMKGGYSSQ